MYSSEVTFGCMTGYSLTGPLRISCTALGEWTGEAPVCIVNN